ncbi:MULTISPECIES: hypothetical protein [unclassified Burkholderia]|uniref:hypothetical protein n=1 Tax=unclassified Burkholderia TaxID=2613784 RepID=UPI000A93CAA2|nr:MULTISPECIES: hypothetical protein [unclassified Burkholderia]
MKHVDDIRFVATGSTLRHAGRVRAPRAHADAAPVAHAAMLACALAIRGAPAFALRRVAHARAAPAMPSPARRRPFLLFALP